MRIEKGKDPEPNRQRRNLGDLHSYAYTAALCRLRDENLDRFREILLEEQEAVRAGLKRPRKYRTPEEREMARKLILQWRAEGRSFDECALLLGVSKGTAVNYAHRNYSKSFPKTESKEDDREE